MPELPEVEETFEVETNEFNLSEEEYYNLSDEEKATIEWQKLNCK